jgi:hypothetical protein
MTIYLDIEILDWFQDPEIAKLPRWRQHAALRFGLATTYIDNGRDAQGQEDIGWTTWWPDSIKALWLDICRSSGPLVTWNGDEFDIPYLIVQAVREGITTDPWQQLPESLDLMSLIRRESKRMEGKERWYKLEAIAYANLGRGKIGHGDEAAAWLRSGDPALIAQAADYCRDDVQIVKELHERLLSGLPLICPARPERREYQELRVMLPSQEATVEN